MPSGAPGAAGAPAGGTGAAKAGASRPAASAATPVRMPAATPTAEAPETIFSEHARGIDFYVDVDALELEGAARLRKRLLDTLAAVDRRMTGSPAEAGTRPTAAG